MSLPKGKRRNLAAHLSRVLPGRIARTKRIVAAAVAGFGLILALTGSAVAEQPGIMCVQNQLNALGFNAGTPDGSIGPQTRGAAEEYRAWMAGGAGGDGWSQAPLTALNGEFWCDQVGKAHPEVAKFATIAGPRYDVTPGQMLASFDVPVDGTVVSWKLHFEFKTQCENDHRIILMSPSGQSIGLMERGLNRCSGKSTVFTSDNGGTSGPFVGATALGTWKVQFYDLDANAYTGALTKWRLDLVVDVEGEPTKYAVSLKGLPKKVPNPD